MWADVVPGDRVNAAGAHGPQESQVHMLSIHPPLK